MTEVLVIVKGVPSFPLLVGSDQIVNFHSPDYLSSANTAREQARLPQFPEAEVVDGVLACRKAKTTKSLQNLMLVDGLISLVQVDGSKWVPGCHGLAGCAFCHTVLEEQS